MNDPQTHNLKKEITIDTDNLYREETFSDLKIGSIRRLIPVKEDGSQDYSRKPLFIGFTQIMTQQGAVPIQSPIDAKNLKQAWERFPDAMARAVDKIIEEAKEIERKASSGLILPGSTSGGKVVVP